MTKSNEWTRSIPQDVAESFIENPEHREPDLAGLAKFLLSDKPIDNYERALLAMLIAPELPHPLNKRLGRRLEPVFNGRKKKSVRKLFEVFRLRGAIRRRLADGQTVTAAMPDAAEEVGMSESKAEYLAAHNAIKWRRPIPLCRPPLKIDAFVARGTDRELQKLFCEIAVIG